MWWLLAGTCPLFSRAKTSQSGLNKICNETFFFRNNNMNTSTDTKVGPADTLAPDTDRTYRPDEAMVTRSLVVLEFAYALCVLTRTVLQLVMEPPSARWRTMAFRLVFSDESSRDAGFRSISDLLSTMNLPSLPWRAAGPKPSSSSAAPGLSFDHMTPAYSLAGLTRFSRVSATPLSDHLSAPTTTTTWLPSDVAADDGSVPSCGSTSASTGSGGEDWQPETAPSSARVLRMELRLPAAVAWSQEAAACVADMWMTTMQMSLPLPLASKIVSLASRRSDGNKCGDVSKRMVQPDMRVGASQAVPTILDQDSTNLVYAGLPGRPGTSFAMFTTRIPGQREPHLLRYFGYGVAVGQVSLAQVRSTLGEAKGAELQWLDQVLAEMKEAKSDVSYVLWAASRHYPVTRYAMLTHCARHFARFRDRPARAPGLPEALGWNAPSKTYGPALSVGPARSARRALPYSRPAGAAAAGASGGGGTKPRLRPSTLMNCLDAMAETYGMWVYPRSRGDADAGVLFPPRLSLADGRVLPWHPAVTPDLRLMALPAFSNSRLRSYVHAFCRVLVDEALRCLKHSDDKQLQELHAGKLQALLDRVSDRDNGVGSFADEAVDRAVGRPLTLMLRAGRCRPERMAADAVEKEVAEAVAWLETQGSLPDADSQALARHLALGSVATRVACRQRDVEADPKLAEAVRASASGDGDLQRLAVQVLSTTLFWLTRSPWLPRARHEPRDDCGVTVVLQDERAPPETETETKDGAGLPRELLLTVPVRVDQSLVYSPSAAATGAVAEQVLSAAARAVVALCGLTRPQFDAVRTRMAASDAPSLRWHKLSFKSTS